MPATAEGRVRIVCLLSSPGESTHSLTLHKYSYLESPTFQSWPCPSPSSTGGPAEAMLTRSPPSAAEATFVFRLDEIEAWIASHRVEHEKLLQTPADVRRAAAAERVVRGQASACNPQTDSVKPGSRLGNVTPCSQSQRVTGRIGRRWWS